MITPLLGGKPGEPGERSAPARAFGVLLGGQVGVADVLAVLARDCGGVRCDGERLIATQLGGCAHLPPPASRPELVREIWLQGQRRAAFQAVRVFQRVQDPGARARGTRQQECQLTVMGDGERSVWPVLADVSPLTVARKASGVCSVR